MCTIYCSLYEVHLAASGSFKQGLGNSACRLYHRTRMGVNLTVTEKAFSFVNASCG